MRVYQVRTCPFAHRARIVLEEKQLVYEVEYFERGKRPAILEGVSSDARSPTLLDDAARAWVWDSLGVIEYLDARYPAPPLMPTDPAALEQARVVMRDVDRTLGPAMGPIEVEVVHKAGAPRDEAKVQAAIGRLHEALAGWQGRLGEQRFLLGADFTLVDIALFTPLFSLTGVLGKEGEIPETLPSLRAWRDRVAARPSTAY